MLRLTFSAYPRAAAHKKDYVDASVQAKQKLPPGIDLVKADDFREWLVDIRVLDTNPLYLNQIYRLSFLFSDSYPIGTDYAPCKAKKRTHSTQGKPCFG
jgi:hypothetical protein